MKPGRHRWKLQGACTELIISSPKQSPHSASGFRIAGSGSAFRVMYLTACDAWPPPGDSRLISSSEHIMTKSAFLSTSPKRLLIDGKWVHAAAGKTFDSFKSCQ